MKKKEPLNLLNKIYNTTLLLINDLNAGNLEEYIKSTKIRDRLFSDLEKIPDTPQDATLKEKLLSFEEKITALNNELAKIVLLKKHEIEQKRHQIDKGTKVLKAYKGIK